MVVAQDCSFPRVCREEGTPFSRLGENHQAGPHAPFSLTEELICGRGEDNRWTRAPNDFAGLRWREEESGIEISETVRTLRSGLSVDGWKRLINDWGDDARPSAFLWFFSVLLFRRSNKLCSINPPEGFESNSRIKQLLPAVARIRHYTGVQGASKGF